MDAFTHCAESPDADGDGSSAVDYLERSVDDVRSELALVVRELRSLWSYALKNGDRIEIMRFVDASHAVQCALVALRADGVITVGA